MTVSLSGTVLAVLKEEADPLTCDLGKIAAIANVRLDRAGYKGNPATRKDVSGARCRIKAAGYAAAPPSVNGHVAAPAEAVSVVLPHLKAARDFVKAVGGLTNATRLLEVLKLCTEGS